MNLLYNTKADDATITASSENVGFETSNLRDVRASRVYRSDGATSITVVFNFGSAVSFSGVGIAGHNFSDSATVTLEWNSADSWGAPAGSQSITVQSTCVETFASVSYQYARLSVTDASNADGYIEMGRVAIGDALTGPELGIDLQFPKQSTTTQSLSRGRQLYADEGVRYRAATITWPEITKAQRDDFHAVFDSADTKPVFIDFGLSSEPPIYCRIDGGLDMQYNDGFSNYTLTLTFEEVF